MGRAVFICHVPHAASRRRPLRLEGGSTGRGHGVGRGEGKGTGWCSRGGGGESERPKASALVPAAVAPRPEPPSAVRSRPATDGGKAPPPPGGILGSPTRMDANGTYLCKTNRVS